MVFEGPKVKGGMEEGTDGGALEVQPSQVLALSVPVGWLVGPLGGPVGLVGLEEEQESPFRTENCVESVKMVSFYLDRDVGVCFGSGW